MATFALFFWPIAALAVFGALGPARGLIWTTLVGYLFLPPNFVHDLPLLPAYGKQEAIALAALLGCLATGRRMERPAEQKRPLLSLFITLLIAMTILSPVLTVLNNRESLAGGVIPGLGLRDGISMMSDSLMMLVPVFLARRYLSVVEHHRELLVAITVGGLVYSFLALFEIRMSPQLNQWVYGYFQHVWAQHIRGGGWRPVVFLNHGLELGLFLFSALIAALILFRLDGGKRRQQYLLLAGLLICVLPLTRNLGAVVITLLLAPVALMVTLRMQAWIGMIVAIVFLSFPLARQMDLLPVDSVLRTFERVAPERASSLAYRVDNEDQFLERALLKPVTGWGIWARWRIFDEQGRDTSTSDGRWVSVLGERGWIGYLSVFGLLTLPMFFLGSAGRRRPLPAPTTGLAVIMTGNLIYLIPNATISPLAWLMVGALARFVETVPEPEEATAAAEAAPERESRYTRFPVGDRASDLRRSL